MQTECNASEGKMPDDQDAQTDAEFWVALGYEMQKTEEADIEFFGAPMTDHVFHDAPVNLDEPVEPEPVPSWGECFTW